MRTFRPALLALVMTAFAIGCSPRVSTGALKVEVVYEAGIVSKCVKVVADDGVNAPQETMPIPLQGKMSPLQVGVGGTAGLVQPFRVQALGFTDEGCTTRSNEESTSESAEFADPVQTVTLVLKAQPKSDGGTDGGADGGDVDAGSPDAGSDAGFDAGLDLDMDGVPQPADCDDTNPLIRPGIAEVCNNNNVDDNCNGVADCSEASCDGGTCTNAGTCTNGMCMTPIEVCNDGVDNNGNSLVDCAESTCTTLSCNDSSLCTSGETCGADAGCSGTPMQCNTPPVCHAMAGVCQADGGMCSYTPLNSGSCDDLRACTTGDSCVSGVCTGTATSCPMNTTNACLSSTGGCVEDAGTCRYAPLVTGPCNDNNACTNNDTCDGDGGCLGATISCTEPSQCHQSTGCNPSTGCTFSPRASCDAGMPTPGSCTPAFQCVPTGTNVFPYTPSTFTEAQLPAAAATALTVSCNTVVNTTGTPSITDGGCISLPPYELLPAPSGGQAVVLFKVSALTVNSGQTLIFTGDRPVIFAVTGSASIDGTLLANSGEAPSTLCGRGGAGTVKEGGGGGGFGRDGGAGGQSDTGTFGQGGTQNGTEPLDPIRGGCAGGASASVSGGAGGGAIQLSVAGTLSISGTLSASGFGGRGGNTSNSGGGGGGSGGAILVEASVLATTSAALFTANGGGGGGGEDSGNGSPGNPGSTTTSMPASGGTGPSNAGNGGNGGAGTTNAAGGENSTNDGAGGGGGAVGRIRLRGTSCTVDGATLFSPPRATGGNGC